MSRDCFVCYTPEEHDVMRIGNGSVARVTKGLFVLSVLVVACVRAPLAHADMSVGIGCCDHRWWSAVADPFKDGYQNVNPNDPNPFKQTFLDEMSMFSVLRMMDLNQTNDMDDIDAHSPHWSERRQKSDPNQSTVCYEWQIELANQVGRDIWVCMPHNVDSDYPYQLATLIRDNLDPSLKCYIEYSNETWNGIFGQCHYCIAEGLALGLDSNEYVAGYKYHAYRAVRMFEAFEDVFGSQMSSRVRKVIAGQSGNTWMADRHMEVVNDPQLNPSGIQPDCYAVAPYVGLNATTLQGLWDDLPAVVAECQAIKDWCDAEGLALLAYEGGQHIYQDNADVVS
nr:hypothetical protein [Anaerolineae bacterium]NIQ80940.1 hypothetical protein [Anaerolineae bacterium]